MNHKIDRIYAFHHNPIDPYIGAGVRTINVLKIMSRIFKSPVILYTIHNHCRERVIDDAITEKDIQKPLLFAGIKAGYLCMFPFLIARQLRTAGLDSLRQSSIAIFETPFMGYAISKCIGLPRTVLKIYNAHNVEAYYWQQYLASPLKRKLLNKVRKIEQHVVEISDYIFVTSEEERLAFEKEYSVNGEKLVVVPNGTDTRLLRPISDEQRRINKEQLRFGYSKYVVFVGSNVKANIDAAIWISEKLAPSMPDTCFLIIGSVCKVVANHLDNVKCLGVLPTDKKNLLLATSDVAINPVLSGAGTNVKMLEYLSAGLPTVTTDIGSRGLNLNDNNNVIITKSLDSFRDLIYGICDDPFLRKRLSENARIKAEEFDWHKIESVVEAKLGYLLMD
ncbi:MAG TPA: glycosyltransferase family 4 protein [Nitrososphaera sp.]|nr:glycosyltransferase family 4 protein [Nitrososphaera sp.]